MNRRRLHRWWALNAAWGCVLVCWESTLLALGLHGSWLLLPTVPVTAVQLIGWRKTRPARPAPATPIEREARHTASSTPRGHCPICGQHDPDGLAPCWGGWLAHESCAEWLGREPYRSKASVDQDRRIWDLAKRQERQAQAEAELRVRLCEHKHTEEIYTYGAGRSLLCLDCGGRADLGKPVPPPGRGAGSPTVR